MTQNFVIYIAREALTTVILVSGPILVVSLVIGLLVSIFQATTSIQEQTLAFVPKIIGVMVAVVFFGPWMLKVLLAFSGNILANLHNYTFIR